MKKRSAFFRLLAVVLVLALMAGLGVSAQAAGPAQVTISVDPGSMTPLAGARRVGANIEMSMTSDQMWQANGGWMEQSFCAAELSMMRWGYDAWAFDWEQEIPLSENRYWGGLNSRDAAGSFGLREFIAFCKRQDIVPFVMIPIESLEAFGGEASLDKVKELTASMAAYIAGEGIDLCYFDMGNEPWNNGAGTLSSAQYLGELFPEFQRIVKEANPNFRLVLQRAPENLLWNAWNQTLVSAAQGAFDAYDDHRYAFYGWDKYFDKNSDQLLTPGTPIPGKEGILGECNIGWTPIENNWDAGHVCDMGGSMALLNAMLEMIRDGRYSHIVSWPSHYPGKASIAGCPDSAFGWFDLDRWYSDGDTVRLTGPALIHQIINQNVLANQLDASSTGEKVRVYAYSDDAQTELRVIVLNKWDETELTLEVPRQMNCVSAMVLKGDSVWDQAPEYRSLIHGLETVTDGRYVGTLPAECVAVYTFTSHTPSAAPDAPVPVSPENGAEEVGTAQTFTWASATGARNYHLVVSEQPDLSDPVIDTDTGMACRYQSARELTPGTTYYWQVSAENQAGLQPGQIRSFTTWGDPAVQKLTLNNDSPMLSYSSGWNQQTSQNSYRNDDASCEKEGAYMEFTFTGTGARLYGIQGPWCGIANVQVDFGEPVQVDTYGPTPVEQTLFFDTGALPHGEHTVTLTVTGQKDPESEGCWIEFDKAEVVSDENGVPEVGRVIWNDDNPNLKKFSVWTHQSVPECYRGDDTASNTWMAHMEFSFQGTEAAVYGLKGPRCGIAEVSVDGTAAAKVDTYAEEMMADQVLYETGALEYGTHTIRITVLGKRSQMSEGAWIEIDRVVWK